MTSYRPWPLLFFLRTYIMRKARATTYQVLDFSDFCPLLPYVGKTRQISSLTHANKSLASARCLNDRVT